MDCTPLEVERLPVEDVVGEALFQQFDQILGRAAANESRLHARLFHHLLEVADKSQSNSAGARLEREAVAHDAGITQEARHKLGDAQAVG